MESNELEARLAIIETRTAALEGRLAIVEMHGGAMPKGKAKRDLTPEEKQVIRARLVAGQERARARREAEAKELAQSGTGESSGNADAASTEKQPKAVRGRKKEAENGTSSAEN